MIGISRNNATARQPPCSTRSNTDLTRVARSKFIKPELT